MVEFSVARILFDWFFFADPPSYLEATLGHDWGISGAVVETGL